MTPTGDRTDSRPLFTQDDTNRKKADVTYFHVPVGYKISYVTVGEIRASKRYRPPNHRNRSLWSH